jgi:RNA polymerase sigma factor (sigma-70 family)
VELVKDYRINVTIKNALLLSAIENAGYKSGQRFADMVGISYYGSLMPYVNLTRSPIGEDGLIRDCAWDLCDFLGASPSDLWSDNQLTPLKTNRSSVDMNMNGIRALIQDGPEKVTNQEQVKKIIGNALDSLTERQAMVIKKRFFDELTLDEIAGELKLSRQRIRQIQSKAIRNLKTRYARGKVLVDLNYNKKY